MSRRAAASACFCRLLRAPARRSTACGRLPSAVWGGRTPVGMALAAAGRVGRGRGAERARCPRCGCRARSRRRPPCARWSDRARPTCACSSVRTCSARLSSATCDSAWIASMRISRSGRAMSGSSVSTSCASPSLPSARTTIGVALSLAGALQHFHQTRHGTLAADLGERVHRALAHPPVGIARRLDERVHGALVLGLVEDLDGRAADVLVLVAHQLQHRVDHLRAADLAERIRGAAAHPPVAVLERLPAGTSPTGRCRSR